MQLSFAGRNLLKMLSLVSSAKVLNFARRREIMATQYHIARAAFRPLTSF